MPVNKIDGNLPRKYSLADDFLGSRIVELKKAPRLAKRELLSRILIVVLPIFHLIDALSCAVCYIKNRLKGKKWVVKPENNGRGILNSIFLELAKKHVKAMFTSIPFGFRDPIRAVHHYEAMAWAKAGMPDIGITYKLMPLSRLGDNLKGYIKAKWIAHKLKLPLIFKPFEHCEELAVLENRGHVLPQELSYVDGFNVFGKGKGTSFHPEDYSNSEMKPGIYEVSFMYSGNVDWGDEEFRAGILKDFASSSTGKGPGLTRPVEGAVNIALHVRTGGTFDSSNATNYFPLKIPAMQYYDSQLKWALQYYKGQEVHVQVFTDAVSPEAIREHFSEIINETGPNNVSIACRTSDENPDDMTVKDMLSMSAYDCLIRSASGLSEMSGIIGQPLLEISPESVKRGAGQLPVIDKACVVKREKDSDGKVLSVKGEILPCN